MPTPPRSRHQLWTGLLVLSWGVQAIVTQSILLRESLVLMFGSEFAWGIVLFAWLFGVAVGALVGGWLGERSGNVDLWLVAVLVGLSVAACAELWGFRGAREWLGVGVGELLPLPKAALAGVLFVSPTSALVGMAFPLTCCLGHPPDNVGALRGQACERGGAAALGWVYAVESVGSLLGGACFSFWAVERLSPLRIALGCGVLTTAAAAAFLFAGRRRIGPSVVVAGLSVTALGAAIFGGDLLYRGLVDRRWRSLAPGFELCTEAESKYQNLAIARREEQFTLYSDGQVVSAFPDPYTYVPLAHFWLCQHPAPRTVLVLGGGAEGLLAEILRHPVEQIDYIEPDARLIALIAPFLGDADRHALLDPRVTVHYQDPRYFIKTQNNRFDLVIARLPEPMSALRARLYTGEFFRELRRAMTRRSVLCMTAAATPGSLSAASAEYLASLRATLATQFPSVTVGWGDPAQVLAATESGLTTIDADELSRRYVSRGIQAERFHPSWFAGATDWLERAKVEQRSAELNGTAHVSVSTDLHPLIYLQRLALWEKMSAGASRGIIDGLRSVRLYHIITLLVLIEAMILLVSYARARSAHRLELISESQSSGSAQADARGALRNRDGLPGQPSPESARAEALFSSAWLSHAAVVLSIGSTGFATMALSIIWLFAFQNLYGYVYQRIGWIVALFMAGLVAGCGLAGWSHSRASSAAPRLVQLLCKLLIVDILLTLSAISVPGVLAALGGLPSGPWIFGMVELCLSLEVLLAGASGGAAFALAGEAQLAMTARPGAAAGSIVAADHAGACLGALLCGVLLVPVFGIAAAALLIGGIKVSSAGLLFAVRRIGHAL